MKIKILFLLLIFSVFLLKGQDIKLKTSVVATAGSNQELNTVNISKWRLGEVHLVVLQKSDFKEHSEINWNVISHPNPFNKFLNLDFKTEETTEFTILVTDLSGKKQWFNINKTIDTNQKISLNLAHLSPAIYLVSIIPKDKKTQRVIKVQKH